MKRLLTIICALAVMNASAQITIRVDANQRGPKISPMHYGIFFEDINHAADGGIYAELIRNRSFEDGEGYGKPATMEGWTVQAKATSQISATLIQPSKKVKLLNAAQENALGIVGASHTGTACLSGKRGLWGINTVQGRPYRLSFWAKGSYKGGIKAMLCE